MTIDLHTCTEDELSKLFYGATEANELGYELHKKHYQCFDYSRVKHRGNIRGNYFDRVMIEFIIPESECRNDPYDSQCVTKAEYEASLGNLVISVMTN